MLGMEDRNDIPERVRWMSGGHGIMVHYLLGGTHRMVAPNGREFTDPAEVVERVFDVEKLMEAYDRSHAKWLIFPFGQNSGFYNAPTDVIEHRVGHALWCKRRDIVQEVAEAVRSRGGRLVAYCTCDNHAPVIRRAFGFAEALEHGLPLHSVFQDRWTEVLRHWSERYGDLISGWWIDGVGAYKTEGDSWSNDKDHNHYSCFRFEQWNRALRAGNPNAATAFNEGGFVLHVPHICTTTEEDFYAGECDRLSNGLPHMQEADPRARPHAVHGGAFFPGTRILMHALVPIDAFWWHLGETYFAPWYDPFKVDVAHPERMEPPCYSDDDLRTLARTFLDPGGALTLNLGVFADGSVGPDSIAQVERVFANPA